MFWISRVLIIASTLQVKLLLFIYHKLKLTILTMKEHQIWETVLF